MERDKPDSGQNLIPQPPPPGGQAWLIGLAGVVAVMTMLFLLVL
jgi:hypothetical protein